MSSAAFSAGTRMRSAKPPGWMRVRLNVSHSVSCPRRHSSHSPHGTWWCTKTRSPGDGSSASTGGPVPTTTPTGSCPSTSGARGSTYHCMRSEPQIPHARIATSTSPGPGSGTSRSSSRTAPPGW